VECGLRNSGVDPSNAKVGRDRLLPVRVFAFCTQEISGEHSRKILLNAFVMASHERTAETAGAPLPDRSNPQISRINPSDALIAGCYEARCQAPDAFFPEGDLG
jgi:hypothetical protein